MLIKPSELSPATADAIAKLIPQYLDKECVKVGGRVELFYRYNNIKNFSYEACFADPDRYRVFLNPAKQNIRIPDPAEENSVTIVDPQPEFFRIRLQYNAEPDPGPHPAPVGVGSRGVNKKNFQVICHKCFGKSR